MLKSNETIFLFDPVIHKNICSGLLLIFVIPIPAKKESHISTKRKLRVISFPEKLILLGRQT